MPRVTAAPPAAVNRPTWAVATDPAAAPVRAADLDTALGELLRGMGDGRERDDTAAGESRGKGGDR